LFRQALAKGVVGNGLIEATYQPSLYHAHALFFQRSQNERESSLGDDAGGGGPAMKELRTVLDEN
jgi:hypothetical protein